MYEHGTCASSSPRQSGPRAAADRIPPNFLLPFPNSTSLSYPRYPAANSEMLAEQVGLHTRGGREHRARGGEARLPYLAWRVASVPGRCHGNGRKVDQLRSPAVTDSDGERRARVGG